MGSAASVDSQDLKFQRACRDGDEDVVRECLEEGGDATHCDPNKADIETGFTSLHWCARRDTEAIAELLLRHKANTEVTDNEGWTPLQLAAWEGSAAVAEVLLRHKANIGAVTEEGLTPLHISAQWGTTVVAKVLLKNKANTEAVTKERFTPLHLSSRCGTTAVAELLLDHSVDTEAVTADGDTALHVATYYNKPATARLLVRKCPTLYTVKNKFGATALDLAVIGKHKDIIVLLKALEQSSQIQTRGIAVGEGTSYEQNSGRPEELKPKQAPADEQSKDMSSGEHASEARHLNLPQEQDQKEIERLRKVVELLTANRHPSSLLRKSKHTEFTDYDLPKAKLGRVTILANSVFDNLDSRPGTDADINNLTTTFEDMKYRVITQRNLTAEEMESALKEIATSDSQASFGCAIVVILSHGSAKGVAGTDGKMVSDDVFFETLGASKKLQGKPKLVLIQACRGRAMDRAPEDTEASGYRDDAMFSREPHPASPGLDMMIVKSAIPNAVAKRHPTKGSLFIEVLTDVIATNCHQHQFEDMLRLVTQAMDRRGRQEGFRACPSVSHGALTKQLFLVPRT